MARPKDHERQYAILLAAIRTIAAQGLGAATATIAKTAGVSNGSLFTYFETKADLLNRLYLDLKSEMATAALDGLRIDDTNREQLRHMWTHWLSWSTSQPEKRRTLAYLEVSDEITAESRDTARQMMSAIAELLQRSREHGVLRDVPLGLVVSLLSALADATTDFILDDPSNAERHSAAAFNALWRMVGNE